MARKKEAATEPQDRETQEALATLGSDLEAEAAADAGEDGIEPEPAFSLDLDIPMEPRKEPKGIERINNKEREALRRRLPPTTRFQVWRQDGGHGVYCDAFTSDDIGDQDLHDFLRKEIAPKYPGDKRERIWKYFFKIISADGKTENTSPIHIDKTTVGYDDGDGAQDSISSRPVEPRETRAAVEAELMRNTLAMQREAAAAQRRAEEEARNRERDASNQMLEFMKAQMQSGKQMDPMMMFFMMQNMGRGNAPSTPTPDPVLDKIVSAIDRIDRRLADVERGGNAPMPMQLPPMPPAGPSATEMLTAVERIAMLLKPAEKQPEPKVDIFDKITSLAPIVMPIWEQMRQSQQDREDRLLQQIDDLKDKFDDLANARPPEGELDKTIEGMAKLRRLTEQLGLAQGKTEGGIMRLLDAIPMIFSQIRTLEVPNNSPQLQSGNSNQIPLNTFLNNAARKRDDEIVQDIRELTSFILDHPSWGPLVKKNLTENPCVDRTVYAGAVKRLIEEFVKRSEVSQSAADRILGVLEGRLNDIWPCQDNQ